MSDERVIPVFLGLARAGQDADFAGTPPIVHVYVAADTKWQSSKGTLPTHNGIAYRALLDTGAEATIIDPDVAQQVDAPIRGEAIIHGFNQTHRANAADIQIVFPKINVVFSSRAAITSVRQVGQTFDLILGRSFLQHCRFEVDGPARAYKLCWVG